jgi:tol-pal system protein YbgF
MMLSRKTSFVSRQVSLSCRVSALALSLLVAAPAFAQDAAELLLRIDRLENLVRQMNGQVEQVQNQNRRLEEQAKRFQNDTDFRFKEIEGGRGGARPANPATGGQPPRQQRSDAFNPDANPQAAGAPLTLGSPGSATAARPSRQAGTSAVANPGEIIAGEQNALGRDPRQPTDLTNPSRGNPQAGNQQTASVPIAPGTPKGDIELGKQQLKNGEYDAAESTFREFTRSRAKDKLLPEAVIGLGDSYFQRQRWREAAEQFVDMTTKFPKSGRAAEAELKLGISLRGLGAAKEACDVLNNHGQKYPNASASIKQGITRELQRARCT